ncbi:hypothetical protein LTR66_004872 [Elasticomyces elasticus]|nr:hypothetical protein LTR66_004872 [Elasticomyces elasticus]
MSERKRFHITPFSLALLKTIIPPLVLPEATGISFHTVQTFPEKSFGYVELPAMEAQKLQKKLNGSILKGSKIRIEEARREKRTSSEMEDAEPEKERPMKRVKQEKRKEGVVSGYELPKGRHVQRGWTEPGAATKPSKSTKDHKLDKREKKGSKHKSEPSKYTKHKELLFKTKLSSTEHEAAAKKSKNMEKEDNKEKKHSDETKIKRKSMSETVIHEFERTTKHPTFIKERLNNGKSVTSHFVEGTGWVDQDGNVVEAVRTRSDRKNKAVQALQDGPALPSELTPALSELAKDKALSDSDDASSDDEDQPDGATPHDAPPDALSVSCSADERSTSSKGHSGESAVRSQTGQRETNGLHIITHDGSPEPSSSIDGDTKSMSLQGATALSNESSTITPPIAEPTKEVHPLEALFKRPNPKSGIGPPKPAPIDTSFSFFSSEPAGGEDVDRDTNAPQTPFTRQYLQSRGARSAAPTPDTAAINRKFSFPFADGDIEEDDEETEIDNEIALPEANGDSGDGRTISIAAEEPSLSNTREESEHTKWFFEHRGDLNRGWKQRRREDMKLKRQRENRRVQRRVV